VPRVLWLLVLLAACGGESAADREAPPPPPRILSEVALGPVQIRLRAPPGELRLGDRLEAQLEVTATRAVEFEPWSMPARLGHFRVRELPALDLGTLPAEARFVLEPERTGRNLGQVPPFAFRVPEGEGAGRREELRLPPFALEVAGLEPGNLPDPAIATGLPGLLDLRERRGRPWGLLAAIAGAAAAGLLGLLVWRRGHARPAEAPRPDPTAEALQALDRLLARDLLSRGLIGEFYVELTLIVRRFVERCYGLRAPELTTEEFLREAQARALFGDEVRDRFARFLVAADLVKYAGQVPSAVEIDAAVAAARAFCVPGDPPGSGGRP
jgi:hypothetical protein